MELAPLRALVDGDFCCDQHRKAHARKQQRQERIAANPEPRPGVQPSTDLLSLPGSFHAVGEPHGFVGCPAVPVPCRPEPAVLPHHVPPSSDAFFETCVQLFRLNQQTDPVAAAETSRPPERVVHEFFDLKPQLPRWKGEAELVRLEEFIVVSPIETPSEPMVSEPIVSAPLPIPPPATPTRPTLARPAWKMVASWKSLTGVWKHSPSDLKLLTMVLPVLVILAFTPPLPKVRVGVSPDGGIQRAVSEHWDTFRQQIVNRAAVDYTDDFRSGLDDWQGRDGAAADWSYDQTGFVRPAGLAIYRPTLSMSDYRFEFLGEIDQKAMGCVFRAVDPNNYYAVKLMIVKPGPLPMVALTRYVVIDGKEGPREERPLPVLARNDTVYRVLVDVRGDDFTIMAQGQVVDFWSDNRLKKGGVGLFCARGEKARVRWVEITHQYDALGRLCAYLAPYGGPGRAGNWN